MDTQDSTDFISALTEAEESGISKDDFLRIWDMEAKLRLLREVEKSKGLKQQESKLQNSMTSTQVKSNGCKGNHKQPENSTEEVKKSSGLQEVEIKEEIKKDLAKDIPQTRWDASASINAALIFETFKKNFDQMRKEFAEEMHQVKEELINLKDTLPARCEKSVHDKLCPEISEKKQELLGLREEVKEWRNEFLELKEAVLAMSRKLEEVNRMGSLNASVNQKPYDMERRLAVMDNRGISSSAVDAETQTFDDNIKQENRESSTGAETGEVEKSEDVEEKQKEVNKSSREDQLNNGCKPQSHQNKEQQLAQPQITQGHRSDLQQTQQAKQQQQQQLAQDRNVQEQQGKGDQCQQQHNHEKQHPGPNKNQAEQLPHLKDKKTPQSKSAVDETPSLDSEMPIFPRNGAIFRVIVQRLTGEEHMTVSPVYRLPNNSKTVSLCVWFNDKKKLNIQLLVYGLDKKSARDNEVYSVSGQIKHNSSGKYTWLFEGIKGVCKFQGPNLKVYTSVCLETVWSRYEDISLDELKRRQYVCDNSLVIRWFVTCHE